MRLRNGENHKNIRPEASMVVRVEIAIDELKALISSQFPETVFTVITGEDPPGTYLIAIVDEDDTEVVVDLYIDRLVDIQVEDGLPVFVIPERTPERARAIWEREASLGGFLLRSS